MANRSAQICIVGGGFGGLYTALHLNRWLRQLPPQLQITLIDAKDHFLFSPLLYEQLTGELQTWEIAPPLEKLLKNTGVRFYHGRVKAIDLQLRQIQLHSDRILTYDYLVLAVGQQPEFHQVPGAEQHALSFRTLADSTVLKQKLNALTLDRRPAQVVIVGGGPNGVELACKLADRLDRTTPIHLIERGETVLQDFSVATQKSAYQALSLREVEMHFNTQVESVEQETIHLRRQDRKWALPANIVIWTAGTRPWDWVRSLTQDCDQQGRLRVTPTLQLERYPNVFALGDVATVELAEETPGATAQTAFQQAKTVAQNLHACLNGEPLVPFHYRHQGEMLTLGMGAAVVATPKLHLTGLSAHWVRLSAYVLRLPTLQHRIRAVVSVVLRSIRLWVQRWRQALGLGQRRDRPPHQTL